MSNVKAVFGECKKEELVQLARSSEGAERYEDMCEVMKMVVEAAGPELSTEERNLLSVAYKNVVGSRRASLRSFNLEAPSNFMELYKGQLQKELQTICDEILGLLNNTLIQTNGADEEAQVFYLKMAADYYRYLAECVDSNKESAAMAEKNYDSAYIIAKNSLPATSPIRLGLALNYSVCLYEIVQKQEDACALAKDAFDSAIAQLDKLEEGDYKDATLIMQLLRDNLTLWTSNGNGDDEDDEN